jgi:hypothetical protein
MLAEHRQLRLVCLFCLTNKEKRAEETDWWALSGQGTCTLSVEACAGSKEGRANGADEDQPYL